MLWQYKYNKIQYHAQSGFDFDESKVDKTGHKIVNNLNTGLVEVPNREVSSLVKFTCIVGQKPWLGMQIMIDT